MRMHPIAIVWRLVLEAATPLSIATGRGDGERDTVLAHDANGLPFIPGSSMAGAMRALVRAAAPDLEETMFGRLAPSDAEWGTMSRVEVSHAHLHDSQDRPVTGLRECIDDPLLAALPIRRNGQRQRVRIDHRGTADIGGLFDRSVLPAGHRFSVEWVLWSSGEEASQVRLLDALLSGGWLRVGGLTRSGMGLLRCVRGRTGRFDLRDPAELAAWSALPTDLAEPCEAALPGIWSPADAPAAGGLRRLQLALRPEGGFRFGGGTRSLLPDSQAHPNADLPVSEQRVVWDGGRGRLDERPHALVPATGVKGALAHRVAFHAHRLAGEWADAARLGTYDKSLHCPTVRRLFGAAGDGRSDVGARAGVLGFADHWLATERSVEGPSGARRVQPQVRMHNHLDRFTGSVRDGLLFATEELHAVPGDGPLLTLEITLDEHRFRVGGGTDVDLLALRLAVEDLCEGRLALGADAAGGIGFFFGSARWEAGFDWPAVEIGTPLLA